MNITAKQLLMLFMIAQGTLAMGSPIAFDQTARIELINQILKQQDKEIKSTSPSGDLSEDE